MPFLVSDGERCALRIGKNTLGGRGRDAVTLSTLSDGPPLAIIHVRAKGPPSIRRVSSHVSIRIDGKPLGAKPRRLRHAGRIQVGAHRLTYDALTESDALRTDASGQGATAGAAHETFEARTELIAAAPAAEAGVRLVARRSGRVYPVPEGGVVIGRDRRCDLMLDGKNVSRRHAVITRSQDAFTLTDASVNGTFVNGARIDGKRVLESGDVIRIGDDEFVFEGGIDPAGSAPEFQGATQVLASVSEVATRAPGSTRRTRRVTESGHAARAARPAARPLATLEVTGGTLAGTVYPVERPVCAIGRGEQNDVRLPDESVSTSHATLLLKDGVWYIVDLRSVNGTFVDRYRVGGERELPPGSSLRIGKVKLTFRPRATTDAGARGTQPVGGVLRKIAKLLD